MLSSLPARACSGSAPHEVISAAAQPKNLDTFRIGTTMVDVADAARNRRAPCAAQLSGVRSS
jgi:hypothetical protein